ncbi:C-type mannose receptor 2-like [Neocloeon triangulifer]|uniref:C-type mannose receptor 2-like n=1 Tax=Neocloeon triangulifer TaxID=2078957 RepID=UPI00286EBEE1|nr:C-type mannose receptor 2-like [Neocloeon triangulifer]
MCSSLGMEPIVIESAEEQKCLTNLTATDWKLNFNYWTGGTQRGCKGQWRWCGSGPSTIKNEIAWAPGQPDNLKGNQSCIHMQIFTDTKIGLRLTDRNCTDSYVFACQGSPKMDLPCDEPECPNGKCDRNLTLFSGNTLLNYFDYGAWVSGCNRIFLFSKEKASWKVARDKCCQIGLTVVSVESIYKHKCIVGTLPQKNTTIGQFWTSGTDSGCPGNYQWCSTAFPFRHEQVNWENGNPKAAGGCVYVKTSEDVNATVYGTTDCDELMQYACEVRQQGTAPSTLVDECASLHETPDGLNEFFL